MNFSEVVSGPQLFLVTLNLRSQIFWIFFIFRALGTLNCSWRGFWAQTFFGHAKFEVKNFSEIFHLQSALDSEFFRGDIWGPTFFGHAKFEVKNLQQSFHLHSSQDSGLFRGGGSAHQLFFGHAKFEVNNLSQFFNYA